MSFKVHSIPELRERRRNQEIEEQIPFVLNGEVFYAEKEMINGEMAVLELGKPVGEMLTSETTKKELLEKVVLDVELGRERVPTVYGPIYEQMENSNFPKQFEAKWAQRGTVIFFEHMESREVKFGSMQAEQGPTAYIKGYSAGFEYTKEMDIFNQDFNLEIINRAFGEAHNAILNHLHLYPIFDHTYSGANQTSAVYMNVDGATVTSSDQYHYLLSLRETLKQGLKDARSDGRAATVLLAHSSNQEDIEDALTSMMINATNYKSLSGITDVVYYDGWEVDIGKKTHEYPGVPTDKAYLVRPKRGFKELIKQRLQIESTMGDITRLVEAQIVGDFWRGVFAALDENVQEITLPS